jgi:solute carrier family 7 (L-type amino acid transporter), member 6
MLLNAAVASFYVIIGTFSSLLTFIGMSFPPPPLRLTPTNLATLNPGISEYLFFFFAVLGVFVLRKRALPSEAVPRTWTLNPIIFCVFSGFIVLRGIITDPFQGLAVFVCVGVGWVVRRWRGTGEDSTRDRFLLGTEETEL